MLSCHSQILLQYQANSSIPHPKSPILLIRTELGMQSEETIFPNRFLSRVAERLIRFFT